ncbi:SMI1/KNR4 family protein [Bacillus safensis]|uniref:SMI1/KNR4 family protein n=1 Tax=Bacillus TaxID=1386 RepID=UPI0007DC1949|nr:MULTISPECIES: SMI1/KNR4 family protein [Bacillus]MBW4850444.1 SMI1/KNR4 family protein [Bacillaceae bacterium]MBW4854723.1 SMI1/KNR4 family protein [Bacillaceae bacterium]MBW4858092.1 SMI1/KNR4 family protein [Bacillaceae bacterium]MCK1972663.1 SMI1/KNR4 family protein [Bacillus safensis]MCY7585379.1 SMI1/KNR4 family protein [Bacillus safensis]
MKSFWEKKEESPFTLEKVDEEKIREAEGTLGVTLPATYKKLILDWNGGFTVRNAFPTEKPNSWADDHVQFDHLRGIAKGNGIMTSPQLSDELELPEGLVIISGEEDTWIAMDYRETKEHPPIHYFDLEMEVDFKLADSFDEFIEQLYTAEDAMIEVVEIDEESSDLYVSKEELEQIFERQDLRQQNLFKMAHYPMEDIEEIEWFFDRMKQSIKHIKDQNVLYEAATTVHSILLLNPDMPRNDRINKELQEIAELLENSGESNTAFLGEDIHPVKKR